MPNYLDLRGKVAGKMPPPSPDKGKIIAVGDERTCPVCAARNGKISDVGPPFHPNCRCKIGK